VAESTARIGRIDISEAQAAADYLRAHIKFLSQHEDLKLRLMRLGQNKTTWITYWDPARHVYVFEPGLLMLALMAELDRRMRHEAADESPLDWWMRNREGKKTGGEVAE
jgi:hypothetical protein